MVDDQLKSSEVSFADLKKLSPGVPRAELLEIAQQLSGLFHQQNARTHILPKQRLTLPLGQNKVVETTGFSRSDPAVSNQDTYLFGTDILTILTQIAVRLKILGYSNAAQVEQQVRALATDQNGNISEEGLFERLNRVENFAKDVYSAGLLSKEEVAEEKDKKEEEKEEGKTEDEDDDGPERSKKSSDDDNDTAGDGASGAVVAPQQEQKEEEQPNQQISQREQEVFYRNNAGLLTQVMLFPVAARLGIDVRLIPPDVQQQFYLEAERFLKREYGEISELNLSPTKRLQLIRKFRNYLSGIEHIKTLQVGGQFIFSVDGVSDDPRQAFTDSIHTLLGNDDQVLDTNIKNTIDALIISKGAQAHEIIAKLDTEDRERLLLLLGIDSSQISVSDEKFITLKNLIMSYMDMRLNELIVTTQSEKIAQGLASKETDLKDASLLEQIAATRTLISTYNRRDDGADDGGEVVAGAVTAGGDKKQHLSGRAKSLFESNEKHFGSFWRSLNKDQQKIVLVELSRLSGMPFYDTTSNNDLSYPIPADIALVGAGFFGKLNETVRRQTPQVAKTDQYIEAYQQVEIVEIEFEVEVYEYEVGRYLTTGYLEQYDDWQLNAMAGQLNCDPSQLQNQSLTDLTLAANNTAEPASIANGSNRNPGVPQTTKNLKNYLRNKKNSNQKLAGAFGKTANKMATEAAFKAFAGGANFILPGAGAALYGVSKVVGEKNTMALVAGGITALVASTLAALSTTLGKIFALAGGVIGGVIGTALGMGTIPLAIGGFIGGAHLGAAIERGFLGGIGGPAGGGAAPAGGAGGAGRAAARLPAAGAPGGAQPAIPKGPAFRQPPRVTPPPQAPTPATPPPTTAAQPLLAEAAPSVAQTATLAQGAAAALATMSLGVLGPLSMIGGMIFLSGYVLLIIFSAFLVPLPEKGGNESLTPIAGFEGCWPTSGYILVYETYGNGNPHRTFQGNLKGFDGPGTAIDIKAPVGTPVIAPFTGTADFYPDGFGIGPNNSYPYGNYVILTTPDFVVILAHMRDFNSTLASGNQITKDVPIVAGTQLGTVDSTGFSDGHHLHYEVLGTNIVNLLPLSAAIKSEARNDQYALVFSDYPSKNINRKVSIDDCSGAGAEAAGYLAIGPATAANIQISSTAEITAGPQLTCSWRGTNNLAAAVNANFFNTDAASTPVGIAGSSGVKYWGLPDLDPDGLPRSTFINQMHSLTIKASGVVSIDPTDPALQSGPFPIEMPNLSGGVTGIFSKGSSSSTSRRQRTLIGMGEDNGQCGTTYVGQTVVFMATMPNATYDEIENAVRLCGATTFVHLDGGGSTAFCSNKYNYPTTRVVPVSIGLKAAEVLPLSAGNPTQ